MTVELTAAFLVSAISMLIALMSYVQGRRRDRSGELEALEQRLRRLEDAQIRMEAFVEQRRAVPSRLDKLEKDLDRMDEIFALLRLHLPKMLADVARGQRRAP